MACMKISEYPPPSVVETLNGDIYFESAWYLTADMQLQQWKVWLMRILVLTTSVNSEDLNQSAHTASNIWVYASRKHKVWKWINV